MTWTKTPAGVLDYGHDWSEWLPAGDSLASSVWTAAPDGLVVVSSEINGSHTVVYLSGGVEGQSYVVTNLVTTAGGLAEAKDTVLRVQSMPSQLVSVDELEEQMSGITLNAGQRAAADRILAGVQRGLERWLNRPVTLQRRVETLPLDERGRLWPRATPVAEVFTEGMWADGNVIHTRLVAVYNGPNRVAVDYLGGVDGHQDPDIRLAILRVAMRETTLQHDDTLTVKDLNVSEPSHSPEALEIGWPDDELLLLKRLKRRVIV